MARHFMRLLLAAVCASLVLAGCADKTAHKSDPFFDEWRLKAEESKGYSPEPKIHANEVTEIRTKSLDAAVRDAQADRPLPRSKTTLKLQNADVGTVLRALARAANQPILMNSNVKGDLTVNVDGQPWDQVFKSILRNQGLTYGWEGNLLRVMSADDLKKENDIEQIQNDRLAKKRDSAQLEALSTTIIGVKYAEAKVMKPNLEALLTKDKEGKPRGSIVVDEQNNAIVVQAIRDDAYKVIRLVENLDKPRSQIILKAHIVEANKDTARDLGVQWGGSFNSSGSLLDKDQLFLNGGSSAGKWVLDSTTNQMVWQFTPGLGTGYGGGANFSNFPADLSGGQGGQLSLAYGTLAGKILETQLSALQKDGKVNILSSPSITTLDNQTAYTENGERVPYVATTPEGKLEVKFEDAVLRLEITPHVIDRDNLRLRVLVKKDEVDTTRNVQGNPFIIKKMTETNLITINGETIVISGLSRDRKSDRSSGIPKLDEVSGIGNLFRRDFKTSNLEEVLIFITPQILPYRSTAEASPRTGN